MSYEYIRSFHTHYMYRVRHLKTFEKVFSGQQSISKVIIGYPNRLGRPFLMFWINNLSVQTMMNQKCCLFLRPFRSCGGLEHGLPSIEGKKVVSSVKTVSTGNVETCIEVVDRLPRFRKNIMSQNLHSHSEVFMEPHCSKINKKVQFLEVALFMPLRM